VWLEFRRVLFRSSCLSFSHNCVTMHGPANVKKPVNIPDSKCTSWWLVRIAVGQEFVYFHGCEYLFMLRLRGLKTVQWQMCIFSRRVLPEVGCSLIRRNVGTHRFSHAPSLCSVDSVVSFHGGKASGTLEPNIQPPHVLTPQKDVS
jgi:hypothetical protein